MDNFKFYTVQDVADILGVTKFTIVRYIRAGQIQAVKIGKYWRITPEALQAFIDAQPHN